MSMRGYGKLNTPGPARNYKIRVYKSGGSYKHNRKGNSFNKSTRRWERSLARRQGQAEAKEIDGAELCVCGHRYDEHTSNSPNPGLGCDHAELPTPRGSLWDNIKIGCACMDFVSKERHDQRRSG